MTAKILVVDDIAANVRLLEAKLSAEYYEVLTAANGFQALEAAVEHSPDVILLDVMMPEMDGFEVCRRLKADERTSHIPVVLLTALDGRNDRLSGLEAGADEFLTKPVDDVILLTRVRLLTRLKVVIDELRDREAKGRKAGLADLLTPRQLDTGARVLICDDNIRQAERLARELSVVHRTRIETQAEQAVLTSRARVDLVIVNTLAQSFDGLRLAAQIRSSEVTRHVPILAIIDMDDRARMIKALDLGVNDVLTRPIDPQELVARSRTQIRRKRYTDYLRKSLDHSVELAVTDSLTGLHNRRYMTAQLSALVQRAAAGGSPVSTLLLDIDFFKKINDTYGHDAGDEVLVEFARRLAQNVRAIDVPCRMGGEEFVVVMPDTDIQDAFRIAERVRFQIAGSPFLVGPERTPLNVTVSVGVSTSFGMAETPETLLKRADEAVYEAKQSGRNRVIMHAA